MHQILCSDGLKSVMMAPMNLLFLAGVSDADDYCKRGGETTSCDINRATQIAVILAVVMAGLYFTVTYVLLFRKLAGYKKLAYTAVQNAIVFNTLQVRFQSIYCLVCCVSPCVGAMQHLPDVACTCMYHVLDDARPT